MEGRPPQRSVSNTCVMQVEVSRYQKQFFYLNRAFQSTKSHTAIINGIPSVMIANWYPNLQLAAISAQAHECKLLHPCSDLFIPCIKIESFVR